MACTIFSRGAALGSHTNFRLFLHTRRWQVGDYHCSPGRDVIMSVLSVPGPPQCLSVNEGVPVKVGVSWCCRLLWFGGLLNGGGGVIMLHCVAAVAFVEQPVYGHADWS